MYSPEKDEPDNKTFNYYVSQIRIRSEHCIGFLKGRFRSLCHLRISIDKADDIRYASLWVTACIAAHQFAMEHEPSTQRTIRNMGTTGVDVVADDGSNIMRNEANDGVLAAERELQRREAERAEAEREAQQEDGLTRAKTKREELKAALLRKIQH